MTAMTECWKWTTAKHETSGGEPSSVMHWGEGATNTVAPYVGELRRGGVIHCYDDPILAVMMDPAHGRYSEGGVLWLCDWTGRTVVAPDKRGVETLTTIRIVDAPVLTTEQRVEIGLRANLAVLTLWATLPDQADNAAAWRMWLEGWISGTDRSMSAAYSAGMAAYAAWRVAVAAGVAAYAAGSAADAAGMAAVVAGSAADAAWSAADAAWRAADAAWRAADVAGSASIPLDLVAICRQVAGRRMPRRSNEENRLKALWESANTRCQELEAQIKELSRGRKGKVK